ncbi:hypothetical protein ACMFMG_012008 [Clarireedia jacksonii]
MNGREAVSALQKAGRKVNKRKGITATEAPLAKRAAVRGGDNNNNKAKGRVEAWAGASGNGLWEVPDRVGEVSLRDWARDSRAHPPKSYSLVEEGLDTRGTVQAIGLRARVRGSSREAVD